MKADGIKTVCRRCQRLLDRLESALTNFWSCTRTAMSAPAIDKANWMGALATSAPMMTQRALNTIAIPGTHDSFTYSLDKNGPIANDEPQILQTLGHIPFVKDIVYNWSVTQQWTVNQQLLNGIRYFDIRISHPDQATTTTEVKVVHGLYGADLWSLMDEVNTFIQAHPKEVVILHFQHEYNVSSALSSSIWDQLRAVFGQRLCPRTTIGHVSLQYCWSHGYQVIGIYQIDGLTPPPYLWTGYDIDNPWADTDSTNDLLTFLTSQLKSRTFQAFFVTQGIETEKAKDVIEHPRGTLIDVIGKPCTQTIVSWLAANQSLFQPLLNITIVDAASSSDYVDEVLNYNFAALGNR